MSGNASRDPENYPQKDVLHTICYVGNVVLAALRK
jgi:hypothetical protein